MSDRLAEIEALARSREDWVYHDDVLALVEIAKAADYVIEADGNLDQLARAIHLLRRKRAALARLDSGATEGAARVGSDRSLHAEMSGYDLALAVRALRRAARDAPAVRGIAERDYSDDDLAAMTPDGLLDFADTLILLQARVLFTLARERCPEHPRSGSDPDGSPPEPLPPPPPRPRTRRRDTDRG